MGRKVRGQKSPRTSFSSYHCTEMWRRLRLAPISCILRVKNHLNKSLSIFAERKRQASGATKAPPKKMASYASKADAAGDKKMAKRHRPNRRRGPRSDKSLRDRGCTMVYVQRDLTFEQWKVVMDNTDDRFFTMEPDDHQFPVKGFPRICRMAYNGGDCFMACQDKETAAWVERSVGETLAEQGLTGATFSDQARHHGRTVFCVVLSDRAEKVGAKGAVRQLLRQNRWPGEAEPIRDLIKPSKEEDKRRIVILYFSADKTAEEAMVLDGLKGNFCGAEVRLRRKKRDADGNVSFDAGDAAEKDDEEMETTESTSAS